MPASQDLIRRGWHFCNQFTRIGFENGLRCFQEAAEQGGADFRAFQAISNSYLLPGSFLIRSSRENHRRFRKSYSCAVALCGLTPELRLDYAYSRSIFELNSGDAEAELLSFQTRETGDRGPVRKVESGKRPRGEWMKRFPPIREGEAAGSLLAPLAFAMSQDLNPMRGTQPRQARDLAGHRQAAQQSCRSGASSNCYRRPSRIRVRAAGTTRVDGQFSASAYLPIMCTELFSFSWHTYSSSSRPGRQWTVLLVVHGCE